MLSVPSGLIEPLASGGWSAGPEPEDFCAAGKDMGLMWIYCELFHLLVDLGLFCLYSETDMSNSFGFLLMI